MSEGIIDPNVDNEDTEYAEASSGVVEESWKRVSIARPVSLKKGSQRYELPAKPADLVEDPRLGLPLVGIPQEFFKEFQDTFKQGQPLLYYVDRVDKLNHDKKYDKRFFLVSNHAAMLFQLDTVVSRTIEIGKIQQLSVSGADIICIHCDPVDVVLRVPGKAGDIQAILSVLFEFKRGSPLLIETYNYEAEIVDRARLKKPQGWKAPTSIYLHTKADLYRQLQLLNNKIDISQIETFTEDPRTNLPFTKVPKELEHIFKNTPFDPNASDLAIVHFVAPCIKVNHKMKGDARYCIVSNSCIYLTYPNGSMQRCIFVSLVSQIIVTKEGVGVKVPSEFDLLLKFGTKSWSNQSSQETGDNFIATLRAIWEFKKGETLSVTEQPNGASALELNKPQKGWVMRVIPAMTQSSFFDYMKSLGCGSVETEHDATFAL